MDFNKILEIIRIEATREKLKLSHVENVIYFDELGEIKGRHFHIELNEIDEDKI
jgi:endonuclease IV